MAPQPFAHLPLVLRERGPARFPPGPRAPNPETIQAKLGRPAHIAALSAPAGPITQAWLSQQTQRAQAGLPTLPAGVPLLLRIDPALDVDKLRHVFDFEVVSEQEDGFVIVASADIVLTQFFQKLQDFVGGVTGSAVVANVHELRGDANQEERLRRVLSPTLLAEWPTLAENARYVCDVGVTCVGTWQVPSKPKRGRLKDDTWAKKLAAWSQQHQDAYERWDAIKEERLDQVRTLIEFYGGTLLDIIDGESQGAASLPDSFTVRVDVVVKGLKDLILNCAYVFEVVEPDHIETPQSVARALERARQQLRVMPPGADAPTVCVVDSGIQEGHLWLEPAVDAESSHCFLPGRADEVADQVRDGGHGTRVAGAVLYGETIPKEGEVRLETWIQNARVLGDDCRMPRELFPPTVLREVVRQYHEGPRHTRIFNHSINSDSPCRTRHMSAWAAEIDRLCGERDVLVIQSAGNLDDAVLVDRGRNYPNYLDEPRCRIANPAQSLQALTVGSVAYGAYDDGGWRSFAREKGAPSAFSRSGLGIWESIKPEVVELGGDCLVSGSDQPVVSRPDAGQAMYPELLRTTTGGGPAFARDQVGTSFAAPKVARIAAALQATLPESSCLLYRALIIQCARWPDWADRLRPEQQTGLLRRIGYGVPDTERATTNSDHRTTFVTGEDQQVSQGDCHVYQVRVPDQLRRPGDEYDIRIEITLSYVAEPRRTRRGHRGYLSVWLDWMCSRRGEAFDAFLTRALKAEEEPQDQGTNFKWTIEQKSDAGRIRGVRRTVGTVQKDWAVVKSNQLPTDFCIAVRGHRGWSHDPEAAARYCLVVTFEIVGKEIPIYEPLRVAVDELQAEIGELQAEVEVDGD